MKDIGILLSDSEEGQLDDQRPAKHCVKGETERTGSVQQKAEGRPNCLCTATCLEDTEKMVLGSCHSAQ